MNIALYEPDIAQNTAAILRTIACFGAEAHIVGPAGFDLSDRAVRRAGLDYAASVPVQRHHSYGDFAATRPGRIVLFTTHGAARLECFSFARDDTLLFGRESGGVPSAVHEAADARVRIPIATGRRSLNLSVAVGIGLWHALSSTEMLPEEGLS